MAKSIRAERGAALIVGLVLLATMTLLVVSIIKTTMLEIKIGGVSHVAAVNFNNAELALNDYVNKNKDVLFPNCSDSRYGANGCRNTVGQRTLYAGNVTVATPTQVGCIENAYLNSGNQMSNGLKAYFANITATATTSWGNGEVRVHQGIVSLLPPQECGGSVNNNSGVVSVDPGGGFSSGGSIDSGGSVGGGSVGVGSIGG